MNILEILERADLKEFGGPAMGRTMFSGPSVGGYNPNYNQQYNYNNIQQPQRPMYAPGMATEPNSTIAPQIAHKYAAQNSPTYNHDIENHDFIDDPAFAIHNYNLDPNSNDWGQQTKGNYNSPASPIALRNPSLASTSSPSVSPTQTKSNPKGKFFSSDPDEQNQWWNNAEDWASNNIGGVAGPITSGLHQANDFANKIGKDYDSWASGDTGSSSVQPSDATASRLADPSTQARINAMHNPNSSVKPESTTSSSQPISPQQSPAYPRNITVGGDLPHGTASINGQNYSTPESQASGFGDNSNNSDAPTDSSPSTEPAEGLINMRNEIKLLEYLLEDADNLNAQEMNNSNHPATPSSAATGQKWASNVPPSMASAPPSMFHTSNSAEQAKWNQASTPSGYATMQNASSIARPVQQSSNVRPNRPIQRVPGEKPVVTTTGNNYDRYLRGQGVTPQDASSTPKPFAQSGYPEGQNIEPSTSFSQSGHLEGKDNYEGNSATRNTASNTSSPSRFSAGLANGAFGASEGSAVAGGPATGGTSSNIASTNKPAGNVDYSYMAQGANQQGGFGGTTTSASANANKNTTNTNTNSPIIPNTNNKTQYMSGLTDQPVSTTESLNWEDLL